jgi:hypothetical protein
MAGNLTQNNAYNVHSDIVDPGTKINDLLVLEQSRLLRKQTAIKPLYDTKQRQDAQLRSMTLRKNAYNYMILVSAVAIGVITALFIIKNNFPVPEWLMNFLLVITIGGSIIYVYILYEDVLKRDIADYEKVDFGLLMDVDEVKDPDATEQGVQLGTEADSTSTPCVGAECCPANTTYFSDNMCKESFSTRTHQMSSISSFSPMPSFTPV